VPGEPGKIFEISLQSAPTSEPMSGSSKRTKQVEVDVRAKVAGSRSGRAGSGLSKNRVKDTEEDSNSMDSLSNSVSSNLNCLENADLYDAN